MTSKGGQGLVLAAPTDLLGNKISYLQGLQLYLTAAASLNLDLAGLTEQQVYQMAVVAHTWQDLEPLLRLADRLSSVEDRYYYLYLAREPELFHWVMADEVVRRASYPLARLRTSQKISELNYGTVIDNAGLLSPKAVKLYGNINKLVTDLRTQEENVFVLHKRTAYDLYDIHNEFIKSILKIDGAVIAGSYFSEMFSRPRKIVNLLTVGQIPEIPGLTGLLREGIEAVRAGTFDQFIKDQNITIERFKEDLGYKDIRFIDDVPYLIQIEKARPDNMGPKGPKFYLD